MKRNKKNEPLAGSRGNGDEATTTGNLLLLPYDTTESQGLSSLLDQAIAKAERCQELAEHYGRLAEKHGRIKAELERLAIPFDGPVILEGDGALAAYAEDLVEEVWGND